MLSESSLSREQKSQLEAEEHGYFGRQPVKVSQIDPFEGKEYQEDGYIIKKIKTNREPK